MKKSLTAAIRSRPTRSQDEVNNSEVKPSGPGALSFGKAKTVARISSSVGIVSSWLARLLLQRKG